MRGLREVMDLPWGIIFAFAAGFWVGIFVGVYRETKRK